MKACADIAFDLIAKSANTRTRITRKNLISLAFLPGYRCASAHMVITRHFKFLQLIRWEVQNVSTEGHFRIVEEQKNRDQAERTSLKFPFYKQRNMQICPLNLDFVLLFLHNSEVAYLPTIDDNKCYASTR